MERELRVVDTLIPQSSVTLKNQIYGFYSLGVLIQVAKYFTITEIPFSASETTLAYRIWLCLDVLYCTLPIPLRLPCSVAPFVSRTAFSLHLFTLWAITVSILLCSGCSRPHPYRVDTPTLLLSLLNPWPTSPHNYIHQQNSPIHVSAIDSARLNPSRASFCLVSGTRPVAIPILLDHSDLVGLKYTLTPLPSDDGRWHPVEHHFLSARQLHSIKLRYAADDAVHRCENQCDKLAYIEVSHPGIVRLDRVLYYPNLDAHIWDPVELVVPPCPQARFSPLPPVTGDFRCQGCNPAGSPLRVEVFGVPPLTLKWSRVLHDERLADAVEGLAYDTPGQHSEDHAPYGPIRPQHVRFILPLNCDDVGTHIYLLNNVIDGLGNNIRLDEDFTSMELPVGSERIYPLTVLQEPAVSFDGCTPESPHFIRKESVGTLTLTRNASDTPNQGDPLNVLMRYKPAPSSRKELYDLGVYPYERNLTIPSGAEQLKIPAAWPGDYSVVDVKDRHCGSRNPQQVICPVKQFPIPDVEARWEPLFDCYGVKGIEVTLLLGGSPPYEIQYTLSTEGQSATKFVEQFTSSPVKLEILPLHGGNHSVYVTHISDANYRNITIDAPPIIQATEEPLSAKFLSGNNSSGVEYKVLNTCEGLMDIAVELSGKPPWALGIEITGPNGVVSKTIRNIQHRLHVFTMAVNEIMGMGGPYFVTITHVADSRGCKVEVVTPGILVNVGKDEPTVGFAGSRSFNLVDRESVELPIILSGRAPWSVTYRMEGQVGLSTLKVWSSPSFIPASAPGFYRIVGVENDDCQGSVLKNASIAHVQLIPRPSVELSYPKGSCYTTVNQSHILRPTCQDSNEHIDLHLRGTPPFQWVLRIQEYGLDRSTLAYTSTFGSHTNHHQLRLRSTNVGLVIYKLIQLGDLIYPRNAIGREIPSTVRGEELSFEQRILAKPSAHFNGRLPLVQYLHNPFVSKDRSGSITLTGLPPFRLELSIRHVETEQVEFIMVDVTESKWQIEIFHYIFRSLGKHIVEILFVSDASGCSYQPAPSSLRTLVVMVHPSPVEAIYPHGAHFCVGDIIYFHLNGSPPWIISFRFNDRLNVQEVLFSPWNLHLDKPGDLKIASVTHHDLHRPVNLNLDYHILPRPSAMVAYPNRVLYDVPVGEQVHVNFTLSGTPPFTFSYQRIGEATPPGSPRALLENERQTIYNHGSNNYVLNTSYEGKWEVVEIADRYCHHP